MQSVFHAQAGHHAQNVVSFNYEPPQAGGYLVW
jgi:hypothetical protein